MASVPGKFRIAHAAAAGPCTRMLDIERIDDATFANVGAKYIIINTGLVLEGGKLVKRAYSLMPIPSAPGRCQIAVKRLDGGPGSNAFHEAAIGAEFAFSGPWGKLVPETGLEGRTLFV